MTPYVSLCGCHGDQENTNLIFHIYFSVIEMLLFINCGRCALYSSFKWGGISLATFWHQNVAKNMLIFGQRCSSPLITINDTPTYKGMMSYYAAKYYVLLYMWTEADRFKYPWPFNL